MITFIHDNIYSSLHQHKSSTIRPTPPPPIRDGTFHSSVHLLRLIGGSRKISLAGGSGRQADAMFPQQQLRCWEMFAGPGAAVWSRSGPHEGVAFPHERGSRTPFGGVRFLVFFCVCRGRRVGSCVTEIKAMNHFGSSGVFRDQMMIFSKQIQPGQIRDLLDPQNPWRSSRNRNCRASGDVDHLH